MVKPCLDPRRIVVEQFVDEVYLVVADSRAWQHRCKCRWTNGEDVAVTIEGYGESYPQPWHVSWSTSIVNCTKRVLADINLGFSLRDCSVFIMKFWNPDSVLLCEVLA